MIGCLLQGNNSKPFQQSEGPIAIIVHNKAGEIEAVTVLERKPNAASHLPVTQPNPVFGNGLLDLTNRQVDAATKSSGSVSNGKGGTKDSELPFENLSERKINNL
jgi:hypothetical protein